MAVSCLKMAQATANTMSNRLDAISLEVGECGWAGCINHGGAEPVATGFGNTEGTSRGDQPAGDSDCSSSSETCMELITPRPSCHCTESVLPLLEDSLLMNKMMDIFTNQSELISQLVLQAPLFDAVFDGDTEGILQCLEEGIDVNIHCVMGSLSFTPLLMAVISRREDVVKLLLKKGANVSIPYRIGTTSVSSLAASVLLHNQKVLELLLHHKADANGFAKYTLNNVTVTATVLGLAIVDNVIPAVKLLLDHGADINGESECISNDDETAQGGSEDDMTLESLLKLVNHISLTPLMLAANVEVATLLLEHGAQINFQPSRGGRTALMVASGNGHYEVAQLLLERGASVDLQDSEGRSALMWAVYGYEDEDKFNFLNTIRVLIQHGANTNLQNSEGKTALDYTEFKGFTDHEVVELLSNPAAAAQAIQTPTENTACNDTPTESLNTEPPTTAAAVASTNDNTNKIHDLTRMFHSLTTRVRTLESEVAALKPQASNNPPQGRTRPNLADALRVLNSTAHQWQNIGALLRIDPGVLENIKKRERGDPSHCLREMLTEWLNRMSPPPTWQALAEAVRPYNQAKAHEIENIN